MVVRRTFAMLLVRNFLLPEVEVAGLIVVCQGVAMADIHQVVTALVVVIMLEEVVDLNPQVVIMVVVVVIVHQQTGE